MIAPFRVGSLAARELVPGRAIAVDTDPAEVEDFLRPSLRHHRAGTAPPAAAFVEDARLKDVRRAFLDAATANVAPDAELVDRAWAELEERRAGWR